MPTQIRLDYERVVQKYFGMRGAPGVTSSTEVTPVVNLDSQFPLPFTPSQLWHVQVQAGGGAGTNAYAGIMNIGAGVCIIDGVALYSAQASDFYFAVQATNELSFAQFLSVVRRDIEYAAPNGYAGAAPLNDVAALSGQANAIRGIRAITNLAPPNSIAPVAGIILGNGHVLYIDTSPQNQTFSAYIWGRYYPSA